MKSKKWIRQLGAMTLVLTLIIPLLAACGNKENSASGGQERVLRIGVPYGGDGYGGNYFRQQYTDIFETLEKDLQIEFVPAIEEDGRFSGDAPAEQPNMVEEMKKKLLNAANPVDVIVTDASQFRSLVQDGLLKQLDPLMQQDQFDVTDIVPAVADGLKAMGDNHWYGLSPTFYSSALFYNKKRFEEAGVAPPKDNMTWPQVFDLAAAVSKGEGAERKYGFSFNRQSRSDYLFFDMRDIYTPPLNLRMFDDKAEKMTVNAPQWQKVWTTMVDLVNKKIIPAATEREAPSTSERDNPFADDDFLSGKVAMMIGDYSYINSELSQAMKHADKIKGFHKFDWDVVTMPSHPEAPGISSGLGLGSIFAINQKATNPEDAWKFLKFVNGERWAKLRARDGWDMVSRQKYIKPKDGESINLSAFYKLKPVPPTPSDKDTLSAKNLGLGQVEDLGKELMQQVVAKKKTVADALKEWETKGNQLLAKLKQNPKGKS